MWRKVVVQFGTTKVKEIQSGRPHPKTRARQFLNNTKDMPDSLVTSLGESLASYTQAIAGLDNAVLTVGTVTLLAVQARTQLILDSIVQCQTLLGDLGRVVADAVAWKAGQSTATASAKKARSWKLSQAMKPFESGGVPLVLRRLMHSAGLVPRPVDMPAEEPWPDARATISEFAGQADGEFEDWRSCMCWQLSSDAPPG